METSAPATAPRSGFVQVQLGNEGRKARHRRRDALHKPPKSTSRRSPPDAALSFFIEQMGRLR
jgi:hypothetical protein